MFGLSLGLLGTALLGLAVSLLAAVLADAAILFYVFVYTLGLKRRSPINFVSAERRAAFPSWSAGPR